jgi:transcriptional regulator with XRE-family HTH domain
MSQEDATRIVLDLIRRGFSQTDIARGLGLGSKGSGSYVGQIAKGVKGSQRVSELRALHSAAKGQTVPAGRSRAATEARQRILGGAAVQRTPRQKKAGGDAAVRKPGSKISDRGFTQAFAGQQSLNGPGGGKPVEAAIRALATQDGRIAIRVVGRFDRGSAAHQSSYWRQFYGKRKRKPGRKSGSANVLEASFGNAAERRPDGRPAGFSAREWASYIDASGTFLGALATWMDANGYDMPDAWVRVELSGWVE